MTSLPQQERRRVSKESERRAQLEQLQELLSANRTAGEAPLTVEQLAARAGLPAAEILRLVTARAQATRFVTIGKQPESLVVRAEDLEWLLQSDVLLERSASAVRQLRERKGQKVRSDLKRLVADSGLKKAWQPVFSAAVARRAEQGNLPAVVASLLLPSPAELAATFSALLNAHPETPLASRQLCELAGCEPTSPLTRLAWKHPTWVDQVVVCHSVEGPEPAFLLRRHLGSAIARLMTWSVQRLCNRSTAAADRGNGKARTFLFSARELAGAIIKAKADQALVASRMEECADRTQLPSDLAWLYDKGVRRYFRRTDIRPECAEAAERPQEGNVVATACAVPGALTTPASPQVPDPGHFARDFERAFRDIDGSTGGRNFVRLHSLRRAVPQYSREAFDAGLRQLRLADEYSLETSHGGGARLTDEEREAGIQEGSSLFVYVLKK
ncbi:MAG: hypothetical protein AB7F89_01195 [Pirellulaceae bacterium]